MTDYTYYTADVFTTEPFGGNPLAVFPEAEGLSGERMQLIARELNLSETVFILPPLDSRHTRRLRIFTPVEEIPFAGHPTVGSAILLAHHGHIQATTGETALVFEEKVGPVPVTLCRRAGEVDFAQLTTAGRPEYGPQPPLARDLAALLSLEAADMLEEGIQGVSCGVPFLFVPVQTLEAVRRVRLRLDLWERTLGDWWTSMVFLFCRHTEGEEAHIHARMFAPAMGIPEDPATGAACAALGAYLGRREGPAQATLSWVVEQGYEMGRPSRLEVEADKEGGEVLRVRVGGSAVAISRGVMTLPG